ncbi:MAG: hypothetical protein J6Y64_08825 [Ruminococcus sp.]|nr:hypothetical protein [Ruminococcus sp.]
MGNHTSKSASTGSVAPSGGSTQTESSGKLTKSEIQAEIDRLKAEYVELLKKEPTGRKGWQKQLQASVTKAAQNRKKIEKLEKQLERLKREEKKPAPKKPEKKPAPLWKRACEGWYIGEKGHEIRQNYDTGGFDIVKVTGGIEKTIKHFKKLSDAKAYKVK